MLTLYYGSDTYRLQRAVAESIAAHRSAYGDSSSVYRIDGSDDDALELIERPLKYSSFFDEPKLIVVRNAAGAAMASVLKEYALSTLSDISCITVQDTNHESCEKKVLTALIKAADKAELLEPLTGAALATWTREYCGVRNATIDAAALTALLRRTQGDTQLLANELDKLLAHSRSGAIQMADINALTPMRYEQDEWELSNALSAHNKRAAISVLWRRLQTGASEQLLLASIAAGIRNLTMVNDMQRRNKPNSAIASTTGLHPFVISKTLHGASIADAAKLRRAHLGLAKLDRASKEGTADAVDGLFSLLLSL